MIHEPTIPITPAFGRGVVGTAEIAASPEDPSRPLSSVQSYLAIGGRVQFGGSQRNSRTALHQCPRVGETIPTVGHLWAIEPSKTGETQALWKESRNSGDSNGYLPSTRSRIGVHDVVFGQTGRTPSTEPFHPQIRQPRNYSTYSHSPWSSVPNGTNMVQKRRSGFRSKKNAIIDLYRHPPRKGVVVCFDELGPLQTIPQGGQQWGKSAARRPDRYRRNGTLQWFGAFCPTTGESVGRGSRRKNAESCRKFWEEVMMPHWGKGSIHLIMDNLSAHKKALKEIPYKIRRHLRVYWLPTNSSWLNLVESYFAVLQWTALSNTNYKSPEEIEQGLTNGVRYLNQHPRPYVWKKI
jgi:transposase